MMLMSWLYFRQAYLSTRGIVMKPTVAYPIPIAPAFWNHKSLNCIVCVRISSTIISTKRPTRSRMEWILISQSIWPTRIQWKWLLKIGIACYSSIHLESQSSMCPGKIMCMSWERSSRHCYCWDCCHLLWLPTLFALLSWSIIVVTATFRSICHTNPTVQRAQPRQPSIRTPTSPSHTKRNTHKTHAPTTVIHSTQLIASYKLQLDRLNTNLKAHQRQTHCEWQTAVLPIKICRFIKLYQL